jgi:hypothetical protein
MFTNYNLRNLFPEMVFLPNQTGQSIQPTFNLSNKNIIKKNNYSPSQLSLSEVNNFYKHPTFDFNNQNITTENNLLFSTTNTQKKELVESDMPSKNITIETIS